MTQPFSSSAATLDLAPGYVRDYISGQPVRATPEEVEAVQVFVKRLVEDLGYPKELITTRPQFRVRARPSGQRSRGYPVDIAVFSDERQLEDDAQILIECKRKTRRDGEKQLRIYLTMSSAPIGVWFNGKDHIYLHKKYRPDGTIEWVTLPAIPRYGQSIADIGLSTRGQLLVPGNLKAVLKDIRNHLAGNTTGITRDAQLAQEIMAVLFCKIVDGLATAQDELPSFRAGVGAAPRKIARRIKNLFKAVKDEYSDVFSPSDSISLDDESLQYVVGELQSYLITEASRDAVGDAFEVFIGPAVRGEEGQFFTPRNVVHMMVDLLDPEPGELLIDPACGSGGFLIVALEHMWRKLEKEAERKGWSAAQLERKRRSTAIRSIRGLDKDEFLTKVTKAYMAIIGDGRGGIFCEDSLNDPKHWKDPTRSGVKLKRFNIVVTNPPFGSKIKVRGDQKLSQYRLAKKWKDSKRSGQGWEETRELQRNQSPQILFIERCIQLLKPGGRLAIVLPESVFGMPKYGFVVAYLFENFRLRAFISMPDDLFQPYTHAKTCVVVLENTPPSDDDAIEMAIADWCGHDSRGNPTVRIDDSGQEVVLDDIPKIAKHLSSRIEWEQ